MKKVILLSLSILLISLAYSFAEVPCKINYQGRLIKDNVPVDGTKTMKFSIYDSAVGPTLLWTSEDVSVTVHNGLFRYVIGSGGTDLSSINWTAGQALYLEVVIDGETLTPREELSAYPYAINSQNSHLLEGEAKEYFLNTSVETQTKDGGLNIMGNVGIGDDLSPDAKLEIVKSTSGDILNISSASGNDGDLVTILNNGDVGIGTTEPDATLHVKGTMKVFGAREARTKNTIYQAATDGFVTAWASDAVGGYALNVIGYTDSSPNPATMVIIDTAERDRNVDWAGISFPVKKDDYWKVKMDKGPEGDYGIYWIPFGN